jgi:hypothetical protein
MAALEDYNRKEESIISSLIFTQNENFTHENLVSIIVGKKVHHPVLRLQLQM